MPATLPALDRPIVGRPLRLDRARRAVRPARRDPRVRPPVPGPALLLATDDGHPRSISYTSWVPARTINGITSHAFYAVLVQAEHAIPIAPNVPCWAGCPLLPDFSAPLTAKLAATR